MAGFRERMTLPHRNIRFCSFPLRAAPEAGTRMDLGSGASSPSLALPAHLQEAQREPQGQCGSMVQHLAGRTARAPRVPLVARSARPAGAARFPRSWGRAGAAAAAASAAALGGLRTR